jgi:dolichol-phosphate mannosyltransferase
LKILESVTPIPHEIDEPTLIVIPTYQERENITALIGQIGQILPEAHILVVDDRSPDGTAEVVRSIRDQRSDAKIELIVREGERGLGHAYRAGMVYGLDNDYALVITMDADGSHSPLHLPAMLAAVADADVVIGSRYTIDGGTINWRIRRILLSWLANRFARSLLRLQGSDLTSGFRVYRREVLAGIGPETVKSNGYSYLVEMLCLAQRLGARVAEVPIIFYDRTLGESKISKKEIYRGALALLRLKLLRSPGHGTL